MIPRAPGSKPSSYTPEDRRRDKIRDAHAWLNGVISGSIERGDRTTRMCADHVLELIIDLQAELAELKAVGK